MPAGSTLATLIIAILGAHLLGTNDGGARQITTECADRRCANKAYGTMPAHLPEAIDGRRAELLPMFQRECAFFTTDLADSFARSVSNLKRLCTDCEVTAFNLSAKSTVHLLLFSHEYG
jgi:hypothetical protein